MPELGIQEIHTISNSRTELVNRRGRIQNRLSCLRTLIYLVLLTKHYRDYKNINGSVKHVNAILLNFCDKGVSETKSCIEFCVL